MAANDKDQQDMNPSQSGDVGSPNSAATKIKSSDLELDAGVSDPTDGRKRYQWVSFYPPEAKKIIRHEALYLFFILLGSLIFIFATWRGWFNSLLSLSPEEGIIFRKYCYYSSAGMLGGVAFGVKYFYRVVARGYWHLDRRIWRYMSPFLAMTIAFIVGALIDASLIGTKGPVSGAAFVSIGFLSGYFADEAVGKMYEIANVLFGKSATVKAGDGK